MGTDKCLLDWEGRPLWRVQLAKLEEVSGDAIAVAAGQRPAWLPASVDFLPDALPEVGPLGGLLAALTSRKSGLVVALAVDLPEMPAAYLADLLGSSTPHRGSVPQIEGRFEPLAAVYPAKAAPVMREWLSGGRRDAQGLISELVSASLVEVRPVKQEHERFFRNLNTPADYALA